MQAAKFDAQHRTLKPVHAVVVADKFVVIARGLSVRARGASEFSNSFVVGGERAALSVSSQVFRWIKTEGGRLPERADALTAIAGGMGLRRIFQNAKIMARCNLEDCV